ncbi:MAG TPA: hypothetical protein VLQ91_23280 [Draconibacterium sp.]|nr:hypothetical protein [Draconibacterium sp.]
MKTKNWVLTTLALFIAAISFATETPKMNIVADDNSRILVSFESATACPVEITITNDDGVVMHNWRTESPQNAVKQLLNLSELERGIYNVTLNYGGTSMNRKLNITRNEIKVGPPVKLYEPYFSFKNDRLNVSFLNVANKNVFLNVYKDGEHYNGFTLGKNLDIQKCIDFSTAGKGKYEVVLTDYFKEHHYTVTK